MKSAFIILRYMAGAFLFFFSIYALANSEEYSFKGALALLSFSVLLMFELTSFVLDRIEQWTFNALLILVLLVFVSIVFGIIFSLPLGAAIVVGAFLLSSNKGE